MFKLCNIVHLNTAKYLQKSDLSARAAFPKDRRTVWSLVNRGREAPNDEFDLYQPEQDGY